MHYRVTPIAASVLLAITTYGCGGASGYESPGNGSTASSGLGTAISTAEAATVSGTQTSQVEPEVAGTTTSAPATTQTTNTAPTIAQTTAPLPTNAQGPTTVPTTIPSTPTAPNVLPTPVSTPTQSGIDKNAPLIYRSNIVYQGIFALPSSNSNPVYTQDEIGVTRFGYGAEAMATYKNPTTGKLNIFISGHVGSLGTVGQIEVPDRFGNASISDYKALPVAKMVQKTKDITLGDISNPSSTLGYDSNGPSSRGLLPYNGKLIYSAVNWYSYTQNASHGAAALDFTLDNYWSGFKKPTGAVANIRSIAGAMSLLPNDWQNDLGSVALTGASSTSIISASSYGPSLNSFDPNEIISGQSFQANTLIFYPQDSPICGARGCDNTDNPVFNWGTQIRGFATVPKSNSILIIGTHGIGGYWYGGMTGPTGQQELPNNQWQGPHSTAYEYRVYAYRASDLALVKSGKIQPWQVKPYAIFPLEELTSADPSGRINSSTYDQETGLLFVATAMGEYPRLHVYKISLN